MSTNAQPHDTPALLPLEEALLPYRGVSIRTARAWIHSGKLPAVKAGRCYLVRPGDLAALLAPVLRAPVARERLTPTQRGAAALSAAGMIRRGA